MSGEYTIEPSDKEQMIAKMVEAIEGPATAIVMQKDRLDLWIRAFEVLIDFTPSAHEQEEARKALKPLIAMRKACGWDT